MIDEQRDIAIVGISTYTPAGEGVNDFWNGLARGGDFITEVPYDVIESYHFTGEPNGVDRFYTNRGGFAPPFKVDLLHFGILPITAEAAEPDQIVALAGTEQALIDADVFEKNISLNKCSVIIGKGNFSGYIGQRIFDILHTSRQVEALMKVAMPELTESDLVRIRESYQKMAGRYQADIATNTMPSLVASLIANRFDMHGAAYTLDAACASGILAIEHSIHYLRSGECDIAVTGGMHTAQSALFWGPFDLMGAISHRGQIAPFSKNADGLLIGQGGGFIVLKTLRKALEDEDRIYAIIKDTAVTSDGAGSSPLVTSVAGEVRVLKKAWDRAGMDPKKIGYIEAHGTGTPAGDPVELTTLKEFFGDKSCPGAFVGSVKSNIGHTMGAAGMMGIIKTALALYNRKIPATLHCEEPHPLMFESRFLPPQELIDWKEDQYPLEAGVNAFGFGGANSHAILTPYEQGTGMPPQIRPRRQPSEAYMLSARTQEALLQKLRTGDFTNTGGNYRLVLFDPTDKRIETAVSIVEKDKPWRGRMDIWFSNAPMLADGGKVIFLCSGFGPDEPAETDSISDMLKLPYMTDLLAQEDQDESSQAAFKYYYITWLCKEGLKKLGVTPDFYGGNSTGEWAAALFAGVMDGSPSDIYRPMLSVIPEYRSLVPVIGIDTKTALQWCDEIPGLYLSNSNCPSQVLLTGTQDALSALLARLGEARMLYSVLDYGTGLHTPLVQIPENAYADYHADINVQEGEVPVWSSSTLDVIPTNKKDYAELLKSQLTRPVYFRELIEKLYDEQDVRVFVQLGVGPLVGFIKETLKGKDFSAVAGCVPERESADQMRRVLAALFVEGREVDPKFLGVRALYYTATHNLTLLPRGAEPIFTEFPELAEVVTERYGGAGPRASTFANIDAAGNPILAAANANMQDVVETQNELVRLFEQMPKGVGADGAQAARLITSRRRAEIGSAIEAADATTTAPAPSKTFEEPIRLTFEEYPYVIDHSIVRQPLDWDHVEDLMVVIPLTMSMELLAEIALKHANGRKLLKLGKLNAYRWIEIEEPFDGIVRGTWKSPDTLELELVGRLKCEFTFGEEQGEPPAEYEGIIDIGEKIMENRPAAELYERYTFHGPQYHSNTALVRVCSRGIESLAERRVGKGSLLDIMGQQIGLFLHLTKRENVASFPVRLKELTFYSDIFDQEGKFEHTLIITKLTDYSITADMVLTRNGKIWSVARDWVNQRFESSQQAWDVLIHPQNTTLANEIAPNVYYFSNKNQGNLLTLIGKRYLNYVDKAALADASNKQWREYLTSRIALKDAVRSFVRRGSDGLLYPLEVFCVHDENGKPSVYGRPGVGDGIKDVQVSLAHKGDEAIAIAADHPVGVDLEKIEEKSEGFLEFTFTERERELLASLKQPEGITRFWVAKEACAKKAGTGLGGNPKNFEISAVDGDVLYVGKQGVQTVSLGEEYVAGWTI
jgi:acyl transferase domain-containing protein/phosphopantetheinyl transferase (holo-ACP synthase)